MRSLRWRIAESVFLIAGLALLDWYIWSRAGAVVYQAYESYIFRGRLREEQKAPPPVTPMPAPPRLHRNDLVGRLEIPRLGIRVMVHEGDDHGVLAGAAGHLPSSPVPGWPGNVAVAAHRDTFFRPLRDIRVNDKIVFTTLSGTFEYQVESLKIVNPDDVSVLKASAEPTLTPATRSITSALRRIASSCGRARLVRRRRGWRRRLSFREPIQQRPDVPGGDRHRRPQFQRQPAGGIGEADVVDERRVAQGRRNRRFKLHLVQGFGDLLAKCVGERG
jgi:sortase A